MREMDELLPHILPYAIGVAEPTAIQHIRDAAVRFCERTRCWRHIDTFKTDGGHHEIVAVPSQAVLHEIEWAKFDNQHELEPRAPKAEYWEHEHLEDDPLNPNQNERNHTYPRYITQVNPTCVIIEPHVVGDLTVSVYLKPDQVADMLPDFLLSNFARNIADGALSTLLLLPNQPFTNPQLAMVFEQKFQQSLDKNFAFNLRGQQRARKRTRASYI